MLAVLLRPGITLVIMIVTNVKVVPSTSLPLSVSLARCKSVSVLSPCDLATTPSLGPDAPLVVHLAGSLEVTHKVLERLGLRERRKNAACQQSVRRTDGGEMRIGGLTLLSPAPEVPSASMDGVSALEPSMNAFAIDSDRSSCCASE